MTREEAMEVNIKGIPVLFVCDRKACGEECPAANEEYNECRHTKRVEHATVTEEKRFMLVDGRVYVEQ